MWEVEEGHWLLTAVMAGQWVAAQWAGVLVASAFLVLGFATSQSSFSGRLASTLD